MLLGKYINQFYKKYWYFFLIGIAMLVIVDWIGLYIPEYLGEIVDTCTENYVLSEIIDKVVRITIFVLLIAFSMMIGRIIWRLTILTTSKRIECDIRLDMFKKAERLSRDYYRDNKVGTIMAWFTSDLDSIEEYFAWGTVMLVDAIFMSILVIVKMIKLNLFMSIVAFIPILLIVVWGALVEKIMSKMWENRQKANDKLFDYSSENFTGIRVIKAFVKERKEIHAFAKVAKENKDVNIRFARIGIIFDVVIEIILALIVLLIFLVGGYLVYLNVNKSEFILFGLKIATISAGELVTFYGYFSSIIWPMIALGQIMAMKARASASLKRICNFLDTPEDIKNPENAVVLSDVKGSIVFKNFSFKFSDSNDYALKNVSFEIKPGEKVGIVGKIGCGKTVLVNILTRMFNVQENAIFVDGVDLMKVDIASLHDAIGYVPQDNFLFSDTIANNIAFSDKNLSMERIKHAAQFANIDDDIERFKDGYQTTTGERGVTLSGGQKQRVSIARAFVKDAPIMLMDDSVSAVDVSTEEIILKNIAEYRKNKTTIVVASRISTVSHFDKILVLKEGEVEAFGSPKELMKTSPTYARMVVSQQLEKEVEGH